MSATGEARLAAWENEGGPVRGAAADDADAQARYGIVRVASERFEIGGYRYDRLADALAEGERRRRRAAAAGGRS